MRDTNEAPATEGAGRRWLRLGLILGGAGVVLAGSYYLLKPATVAPAGPNAWGGPVPVRVVPVQRAALVERSRAIGTVTPLQTVTVRSRVDGTLARVLFTEGQDVRAGQALAEIDPEPYRVALAQAQGSLQQIKAQLTSAERDLTRYRTLFEQDSVARQQLDSQEALVAQLRGSIQNAQAQVDDAKLKLSYTRIEAPIGGRLGLRQVDAGNLVTASASTGLVTITQTRPISLTFTVPEHQLTALRQAWKQARESGADLTVEAWDRSEQQRLAVGRLTTMDNQIDAATATLRLKAQFDNRDDELFPNQFVNVRLQLRTQANALVIPADAVQHGARGDYVYVIQGNKAALRNVSTGVGDDGRVAVLSGLTENEQVVLEGLDRLSEGRDVVLVEDGPAVKTATQLKAEQQAQAAP